MSDDGHGGGTSGRGRSRSGARGDGRLGPTGRGREQGHAGSAGATSSSSGLPRSGMVNVIPAAPAHAAAEEVDGACADQPPAVAATVPKARPCTRPKAKAHGATAAGAVAAAIPWAPPLPSQTTAEAFLDAARLLVAAGEAARVAGEHLMDQLAVVQSLQERAPPADDCDGEDAEEGEGEEPEEEPDDAMVEAAAESAEDAESATGAFYRMRSEYKDELHLQELTLDTE